MNLCGVKRMTDLTKDWKDGKLSAGWYYVKFPDTEVEICGFYKLSVFRLCADTNEIKILSEVPDYTAWQNLWNTADMEHKANNKLLEDVERLEKENKELKKQVNYLSKTQARQFVDNQKLQVKAEKAKDVVDIEAARKIKELERELKKCVKTCTPLQITLILSLTLKNVEKLLRKFL